MKSLLFLNLLLLVAASIYANSIRSAKQDGKKLVCYYGSWAVYRPGNGKFDVEDMDPMICTHLIYGFAGIDGSTHKLKILDPYNDLEENWGKGAMRRFTNLTLINPDLKVLLAVGGWNEGSTKYSDMAMTQETRKIFIDSVVSFVLNLNFDGFDLDWEYPTQRGGRPEDKENFVLLCQEMKAAFAEHGLLLTAAVSAGEPTIESAYDVPAVSNILDFINVMTYDFHGGWEDFTHHHSPMDIIPELDVGNVTTFNVKHAINYWIEQGADPSKLILGMGSYGRGWNVDNEAENGFYAPASQLLEAGPYTREPGIWGYNEILEQISSNQWEVVRNEHVLSPYATFGRKWIGYDDTESIAAKVEWANSMGLGGGMFWSIETDDFRGLHSAENFPLLKTARRGLIGDVPPPPTTTTTTPDPTAPTTTPTTTTPRPTAEPGVCTEPGPIPNPEDCFSYLVCVPIGDDLYKVIKYDCPEGTAYFPDRFICDWWDGPGCPTKK